MLGGANDAASRQERNRMKAMESRTAIYGASAKMMYVIVSKLKEAGAVSPDKAVTPHEAELDLAEARWLTYLAGGTLSRIKKTRDGKYYV